MKYSFVVTLLGPVRVLAGMNFVGITASNSIGGASSYTCRTADEWNKLASDAKSNGFKSFRILGFDCNALDLASAAAAANDLTILAGISCGGTMSSCDSSVDADVGTFQQAYAKYGANRYVGLTVGNEVADSPESIMRKVNSVSDTLKAAGIQTPVSTAHTWVMVRDNKAFCNGAFLGANAHAYYDGGFTAEQSGDFLVKLVIPALQAACPGKNIIITESGFPSSGAANNAAVPSAANEVSALRSLNCVSASRISVYAFEYDDQNWKGNDVERSFGIFGKINLNDVANANC